MVAGDAYEWFWHPFMEEWRLHITPPARTLMERIQARYDAALERVVALEGARDNWRQRCVWCRNTDCNNPL